MADNHGLQTLADAADELTNPRRHVETITAWVNRNRKTIRRITTMPSLLDQLAAAVIPGETRTETEAARSGFGSRPPARLDAIDRLLAIQTGAARWVISLGLQLRPQTAANIRALVGAAGILDSDTLDAMTVEVVTWRLWAATVTRWQNPPYQPYVGCPACERRGTLRVRLARRTATCAACGTIWNQGAILTLADEIRAATELVGASA